MALLSKLKPKTAAAILTVLMVACIGLLGCSNSGQAQQKEESIEVIGKETGTSVKVLAENGTGKDITAVSVKPIADAAYPASLLEPGKSVAANKKVYVCFEPAAGTTGTSGNTTDVALRPLYDVQIGYADGTSSVLHNLNLNDLKEVKLIVSPEGIGYIEYKTGEGKTESTLETEKALIAAKAAAEAEAAAAAAAAAEAAAQNANGYSGGSSGGGGYDYGSSGGSSGGSSAGQTEDQCVPDVVLR